MFMRSSSHVFGRRLQETVPRDSVMGSCLFGCMPHTLQGLKIVCASFHACQESSTVAAKDFS